MEPTSDASFGSFAEQYHRYRPGYPEELINDLMRSRPRGVLDVGCETGKVAAPLARRGVTVLGVEADERMAAVARRHKVPVEVATFEAWEAAGRQFDLLTSGQAWHLIDPVQGVAKAARLLRPGGRIARFWNYHVLDADVLAIFEAIYPDLAPDARTIGHAPTRTNTPADPFDEDEAFTSVKTRTYRWERTMTAEDWLGLIATFTDHQRLGSGRLAALQQALHGAVWSLGGHVQVHGGTHLLLSHRTTAPPR